MVWGYRLNPDSQPFLPDLLDRLLELLEPAGNAIVDIMVTEPLAEGLLLRGGRLMPVGATAIRYVRLRSRATRGTSRSPFDSPRARLRCALPE